MTVSFSYDLMDQCYPCLRDSAKIIKPNRYPVSGEQVMATFVTTGYYSNGIGLLAPCNLTNELLLLN